MTFPLLSTVTASYRDVYGDLKSFIRATWLIWLLLVIFVQIPTEYLNQQAQEELRSNIATDVVATPEDAAPPEAAPADAAPDKAGPKGHVSPKTALMLLGVNVIQALIIFCFGVAWFRALLLHEGRGQLIRPRLGKREAWYIWTNMKVSLAITPIFLLVAGFVIGEGAPAAITAVELLVIACAIYLILYLQARLVLAYPLSAIGQNDATVAKAWSLSKGMGNRILLGNILVFVPQFLALMFVISGLAWLFGALNGSTPDGQVALPAALSFVLKGLGAYFLLMLLGVTSAFHARIYATLVRQ